MNSKNSESAGKPSLPSTRFLDGLRGLAAWYVLMHHASYLLHDGRLLQLRSFGRYEPRGEHAMLTAAVANFMYVFRFGHAAVIFFFVLSGFVIHLKYARQLQAAPHTARFGWLDFLRRRSLRLYPPLILGLLITAACDLTGRHFGWPPFTGATPYNFPNVPAETNIHPLTFFGNLAFLQTVYVPAFGTDGPVWSLMYEWWFYMIYPALWWITRKGAWYANALVLFLAVAAFLLPKGLFELPRVVLPALPAWWCGVLLADIYTRRIRVTFGMLSPTALLLPFILVYKGHIQEDVYRFLLAASFAGLLAAGFRLQERFRLRLLESIKWLGDMSFTLYVIHMPILVLLCGWATAKDPKHRLPVHPGLMFGGAGAIMVLAYVAHWIVEKPFATRRKTAPVADKHPGLVASSV